MSYTKELMEVILEFPIIKQLEFRLNNDLELKIFKKEVLEMDGSMNCAVNEFQKIVEEW